MDDFRKNEGANITNEIKSKFQKGGFHSKESIFELLNNDSEKAIIHYGKMMIDDANVVEDFKIRNSQDKKMSYDAILSVIFTKKGLQKFLDYAKIYISKFNWSEQLDPTLKSYYSVITFMIREMEPEFMCTKEEYLIHLHYPEVAAMFRSCKIFQIEIGEENEDQKFFQNIVNKLMPII